MKKRVDTLAHSLLALVSVKTTVDILARSLLALALVLTFVIGMALYFASARQEEWRAEQQRMMWAGPVEEPTP